jgi:hypothetical protein
MKLSNFELQSSAGEFHHRMACFWDQFIGAFKSFWQDLLNNSWG